MARFENRDPIPLLNPSQISYSEMLAHAESVDQWLGFRLGKIEKDLQVRGCLKQPPETERTHQRLWFGLAEQALLTPYIELRWLLSELGVEPGQTVVDLGAGYGRLGLVMEKFFPESRFVGYEYVGERVEEARRIFKKWNLKNAEMIHADLFRKGFALEEADVYFLYDYGSNEAIEKTLFDLKRISKHRPFKLVARGRNSRYSIESRHEDWLKKIDGRAAETRATVYTTENVYAEV